MSLPTSTAAGPSGVKPTDVQGEPKGSSVSTLSLEQNIKDVLASHFAKGVFDGSDIQYVQVDRLDNIVSKISEKIQDGLPHRISPARYDELSQEVANLKLQLARAAKTSATLETMKALLQKDLAAAREALTASQEQSRAEIATIEKSKAAAIAALTEFRMKADDLKRKISAAKTSKDTELESKLSEERKANAETINRLNDVLQAHNTDVKMSRERVTRLETQVLELSTELNLVKSKSFAADSHSGNLPLSFAEAAKKAGTESVNLTNLAWKALRNTSKGDLEKAKNAPDGDVKDQFFWIKATIDHSKHAIFRPYKIVLDGVLDDIKHLAYESRKQFLPLGNAILDSLSPTGSVMTEKEFEEILSKVDTTKLLLAKQYRRPGLKYLSDVTKLTPEQIEEFYGRKPSVVSKGKQPTAETVYSDSEDDAPKAGTFSWNNKKTSNPLPARKPVKITEPELTKVDPIPEVDSDTTAPKTPPKKKSWYKRAKAWFSTSRKGMRRSVQNALINSQVRLERYYSLATGGFFKRMLLIPYSWWISIF